MLEEADNKEILIISSTAVGFMSKRQIVEVLAKYN